MITINDIADLVETTIKDLVATGTEIFVSPIGEDKLKVTVSGKICNFTLAELMEQKHSARDFINLIKEKIS